MSSIFPSWLIGVTLSFGGCTLSNLGINMQKLSHTQKETDQSDRSLIFHPLWLFGLGLLIIGSIADLVSFGFADMSLLAPLGAMTLVVNMFIAPCFNREKLSKRDIAATCVILLGTLISISFGSKSSPQYTSSELLELYTKPLFIAYAITLGIVLIAVLIFLRRTRNKSTLSGFEARAEALAYPTLAGTFGAHSVLFAKSSAEIVKSTIAGNAEFTQPASYFMIALLFVFLFLQMRALNEGLSKADALIIVPVYQVSWVVMNTVVGMMYFQDYKHLGALEMSMFFLGLMVTLGGVYLLARRELVVKRSIVEEWVISDITLLERPAQLKHMSEASKGKGKGKPDEELALTGEPSSPQPDDRQTAEDEEYLRELDAPFHDHSYSYRYASLASEETEIST